MNVESTVRKGDFGSKTVPLLIVIALVGAAFGVFCGYKIEDYRFNLAFDKVHLKEAEFFMEWYVKICQEEQERRATRQDAEHE